MGTYYPTRTTTTFNASCDVGKCHTWKAANGTLYIDGSGRVIIHYHGPDTSTLGGKLSADCGTVEWDNSHPSSRMTD
eukprot:gene1307-5540_t